MSHLRFILLSVVLLSSVALFAHSSKKQVIIPPPPTSPSPAVTNEFIQKRFGDTCTLMPGPPQFVADLDDDGIPDLVVVARCVNPIADQDEYGFKVIDPYDSFLGFGNVKITSTFASDEPELRGVCLLIVHGSGSQGFRAEKPKAKYLIINLPFKTLSVKKFDYKKRQLLGVFMEERGEGESTSSVIFWTGKKYRYQQIGATLE